MGRAGDGVGVERFAVSGLAVHEVLVRELALEVALDHPAFAGHFPGQPLLPGVSLLAEVLEAVLADQALAKLVGPAPRIASAKFLAPVRPGAHLVLRLEVNGRALRFEVREGERIAATGQFEVTS